MNNSSIVEAGDLSAALTVCDREAIHVPGGIQPHGCLFVVEERRGRVLQVSDNVEQFFGRPPAALLDQSIAEVLGWPPGEFRPLLQRVPPAGGPVLAEIGERKNRPYNTLIHRHDGVVVIEIEPAPRGEELVSSPGDLHTLVSSFIAKIQGVESKPELLHLTAQEVRRITAFDRVLIYRFDPDGTGIVVGEDGSGALPSYQDHRFPASDIPRQARELYRLNRLRIIPDVQYAPSAIYPPINPQTGRTLDLTYSTLRSVSPVHVEYMKNMGTASSMLVSILMNGRLWGLIACHHSGPRFVSFELRTACDLLAQVFSLQLVSREHTSEYMRRAELKSSLTLLLARVAQTEDFVRGFVAHPAELLGFAQATGAAVVANDRVALVGSTPSEQQTRELAAWLFQDVRQEVFHTDALASVYPSSNVYSDKASGLLAISVSRTNATAVLWFRPEVIETIRWGGDPHKAARQGAADAKIHPRRSFETWKETVRGKSVPWLASEVDASGELRNALLGIVLKKAEELAALNVELNQRNQELALSNKELEAFSYSVSHDLRAPLRHIVGYAELLKDLAADRLTGEDLRYVNTIVESSEYAGKLVDNLLSFSRMGRTSLERNEIDMNLLVDEVRADVMTESNGRPTEWSVAKLPVVVGDLMMLKLAVRNLLSNAIKYTVNCQIARIAVQVREGAEEFEFSVKDNGVGFDMRFRDKLFGVFQRLHRWEDFQGTGIGLANVRRIVERHGGRVWAEGEVDRGATFYFTLPKSMLREVSTC